MGIKCEKEENKKTPKVSQHSAILWKIEVSASHLAAAVENRLVHEKEESKKRDAYRMNLLKLLENQKPKKSIEKENKKDDDDIVLLVEDKESCDDEDEAND